MGYIILFDVTGALKEYVHPLEQNKDAHRKMINALSFESNIAFGMKPITFIIYPKTKLHKSYGFAKF